MELNNEFEVPVDVERAWAVLTDLERIAPCLPGAQLTEVDGAEHKGTVKIKVGPITAQYKGTAHFTEKDDERHQAVIDARGRDTRGQGNANAIVTAGLEATATGTRVSVDTDLKITGKVAQFGRGTMAEVSAKLLDQFVECLRSDVLVEVDDAPDPSVATAPDAEAEVTPEAGAAAAPVPDADAAVRGDGDGGAEASAAPSETPEPEALDLLSVAGASVAKRVVPALLLVLLVVIALVLLLT